MSFFIFYPVAELDESHNCDPVPEGIRMVVILVLNCQSAYSVKLSRKVQNKSEGLQDTQTIHFTKL